MDACLKAPVRLTQGGTALGNHCECATTGIAGGSWTLEAYVLQEMLSQFEERGAQFAFGATTPRMTCQHLHMDCRNIDIA